MTEHEGMEAVTVARAAEAKAIVRRCEGCECSACIGAVLRAIDDLYEIARREAIEEVAQLVERWEIKGNYNQMVVSEIRRQFFQKGSSDG